MPFSAWLEEHLPTVLQEPGWLEIARWKWAALPLLFGINLTLGTFLARVTRWIGSAIIRRTQTHWDNRLTERTRAPLTLGWAVGLTYVTLRLLELGSEGEDAIIRALRTLFFFAVFWGVLRVADVLKTLLLQTPWAAGYPSSASLVPLTVRIAKIAIFAVALVAILADLGFPVASLLAGLGVGGLALALAAQKTVENLFGALTLGLDQPFRVGDFVKVDDLQGNVELIGMRSTRIRTVERTLVTMPNGKLADSRIETFAARDRIRFFTTLSLALTTTAEQLHNILKDVEAALRKQNLLWPDGVTVQLKEISPTAFVVDVGAWFRTKDLNEFGRVREQLLLELVGIVRTRGTQFALPAYRVELQNR